MQQATTIVIKEFFHQATNTEIKLLQGWESGEPVWLAVIKTSGANLHPTFAVEATPENLTAANSEFKSQVKLYL